MTLKEHPEQIRAKLEDFDFNVHIALDVQTAFYNLKSHSYTFLLLDLDLDGVLPFIKKVITTIYDPPPYIMAVDAFRCSLEQADILGLGADACLEKPLDLKEMLAVMNAALRRTERLACPILSGEGWLLTPCVTV